MSALSLWERQRPGRNLLGSFSMTKDERHNTRYVLSLYLYLFKLTVNITSYCDCFNNKNGKYFVCTTLDFKCLESLLPYTGLWSILQSVDLALMSMGWINISLCLFIGELRLLILLLLNSVY